MNFENIKKELERLGFEVAYNRKRREYAIYNNSIYTHAKLYMSKETVTMNTVEEIQKEYNSMIKHFKNMDYLIANLENKDIKEMTLKEFIKADGINPEVTALVEKHFKSLPSEEKRKIRREYDNIREYVYNIVKATI